jgi:hypothetical protein
MRKILLYFLRLSGPILWKDIKLNEGLEMGVDSYNEGYNTAIDDVLAYILDEEDMLFDDQRDYLINEIRKFNNGKDI